MPLPEKREFGWKLKPFDSAHTEINILENGQTEVIIKHDVIKGINVDMLVWWFTNFVFTEVIKN
jgi:hypothetical protein